MSQAIQLSSKSVEHYGPPWLPAMVREVFGGPINLDPASCHQANLLIQAERYYSELGIEQPWSGNVYLNPPGGRVAFGGAKVNSAALWYAVLAQRYMLSLVSQAIFMVFNLELFRYAQLYKVPHPTYFPHCFPTKRIDFWKPGTASPVPQGTPGHPNAIVYMGPHVERFKTVFQRIGRVQS